MKAAKSQCGLSRGRMGNIFFCHKCWVLTLSHLSDVNQRMEEDVSKHFPVHRELAKTQMKRDVEAVQLVLKWFEEITKRSRTPPAYQEPPAVISRFDRICLTGPQEQISWTTLITSVSSSTFSLQPFENITSLWSSVTLILTLQL